MNNISSGHLSGELWLPWSDSRRAWAPGLWAANQIMAVTMCARLNSRETVEPDWRPVRIDPVTPLIGG